MHPFPFVCREGHPVRCSALCLYTLHFLFRRAVPTLPAPGPMRSACSHRSVQGLCYDRLDTIETSMGALADAMRNITTKEVTVADR